MNLTSVSIPQSMHCSDHLDPDDLLFLGELLDKSLINPLHDFFHIPGKNIRSLLVELGFRLAHTTELSPSDLDQKRITTAASIIEAIHNGALIIDDIQDESLVRRMEPTLHLKYGVPRALNAGNWLYFWALEQIKLLELDQHANDQMMNNCLRLMSHAHLGQALDVGTEIDSIPQHRVHSTCIAAMELKTGTLMSLALMMGGVLGAATASRLQFLEKLGGRMGLLLQMFDDLGNFFEERAGVDKRYEDMKLRRPSWVWALASKTSEESYSEFKLAVNNLPESEALDEWIEKNHFRTACLLRTEPFLYSLIEDYQVEIGKSHPVAFEMFTSITNILEKSYVGH